MSIDDHEDDDGRDSEDGCFISRLSALQVGETTDDDLSSPLNNNNNNTAKDDDHDAVANDNNIPNNKKKPQWWKRKARRRGTRRQRAVLARMTEQGYVIQRRKKNAKKGQYLFGTDLDLVEHRIQDIFNNNTRGDEEASFSKNDGDDHDDDDAEYWLEVGFGRGENLLASAKMHPRRRYIGAEIYQPGACAALGRIMEEFDEDRNHGHQGAAARATATATATAKSPCKPYSNLRIHLGDGIKLLQSLPPSSLSGIILPFPDPFPFRESRSNNNNEAQWRLIQPDTLRFFERVLKPNGSSFFYLATDSQEFDAWCRHIFDVHGKRSGWREIVPCPDRAHWLPAVSHYEEKGIREGRSTILRCFGHSSAVLSKELK